MQWLNSFKNCHSQDFQLNISDIDSDGDDQWLLSASQQLEKPVKVPIDSSLGFFCKEVVPKLDLNKVDFVEKANFNLDLSDSSGEQVNFPGLLFLMSLLRCS